MTFIRVTLDTERSRKVFFTIRVQLFLILYFLNYNHKNNTKIHVVYILRLLQRDSAPKDSLCDTSHFVHHEQASLVLLGS